LKKEAALAGAMFLRERMRGKGPFYVVLGTGSTAGYAFEHLKRLNIIATDTSSQTLNAARKLGIKMLDLEEFKSQSKGQQVYAIDGADEIYLDWGERKIHMIKGGGGCHTKERIAGMLATVYVAVADSTKKIEWLGQRSPLPVEIRRGEDAAAVEDIVGASEAAGVKIGYPKLRLSGGAAFVTDYAGGNILDVPILYRYSVQTLMAFGKSLEAMRNIISHGLFFDTATAAVIADGNGARVFRRGEIWT